MAWLIIIAVVICLIGIIYLILWIRKIEKKVDGFMDYLIKLDDKNYRLWKAKLKAETFYVKSKSTLGSKKIQNVTDLSNKKI